MDRKLIAFLIAFQFSNFFAAAQNSGITPLFQNEKPLTIRLRYSMRQVLKNTNDTVYIPSVLHYKNEQDVWDSLTIGLRARGNFRRNNCSFAPLRIKIKKNGTKETVFTGNKSLKLVLPCKNANLGNGLVMKEYLCYKLYEAVTPYVLHTRLADVQLTDISKQDKSYGLKGFFIEDDDLAAKRFGGKVTDSLHLHPLELHDTSALRFAFFQYLIGNTDWSTGFYHNVKVIKIGRKKYVPVAYDFDMAGFVNAPYATVNETLDLLSVRERLYRGYCRNEPLTQFVRAEFIQLEPTVLQVIDRYGNYFEPKELTGMKKYLDKFFDIIKNDDYFKENILRKCRTK